MKIKNIFINQPAICGLIALVIKYQDTHISDSLYNRRHKWFLNKNYIAVNLLKVGGGWYMDWKNKIQNVCQLKINFLIENLKNINKQLL